MLGILGKQYQRSSLIEIGFLVGKNFNRQLKLKIKSKNNHKRGFIHNYKKQRTKNQHVIIFVSHWYSPHGYFAMKVRSMEINGDCKSHANFISSI